MDSNACRCLYAKKLARMVVPMSTANGAAGQVKNLLDVRGLTVGQVSNISGVEPGKVADVVAGDAGGISLREGALIADALGVELPDLLGRAA